jgi:hypothetical protein
MSGERKAAVGAVIISFIMFTIMAAIVLGPIRGLIVGIIMLPVAAFVLFGVVRLTK